MVTALFCVTVAGCAQSTPEDTTQQVPPPAIIDAETLVVEQVNWPRIIRSQGSLYPDEEATLGLKIEGRVVEVHADLGDVVEAGTSLVTVYQDDFQLRVEQAEAQLRQARSAVGLSPEASLDQLEPLNAPPVKEQRALWDEATANLRRAKDLLEQNALTRAEFDQIASAERVAAARYDSALNSVREKIAFISVQQSTLDLARENLANTVLKAPFTAVVQRRLVAPGSYVKVGDPLLVLVRVDKLRYRGTVPERLSQMVQIRQPIELQIESISEPRTTTVSRISPLLDQASRALTFEAVIENDDRVLRAGLFAEAELTVDSDAEALAIPEASVVQFAGTQKVWKVVNGEVREQEILLGDRREGYVRVLSGLNPGDVILNKATQGRVGVLASTDDSSEESPAPSS
ncbi:efflux RND transporter periplasmic adaptor subunit [Rubinisphaera margarita]|uniref:efflux RND transporter periplasmic adaptor subunit n=1 Tax=Rubinisphaera margarita TaxID=2909586 RepID=UPI001EE938E0|nr:efflux RND transporter periplasmic adaptor subunit [Rubinisphaera margarita]MCG6156439.1 efflux RND transporter periplasmic adaptor subunit [Rubinisphaera margarita]